MPDRIETPRLALRRLRREDAAPLAALANDWNVVRMLTRLPYPYASTDALAYIDGAAHSEWEFAVEIDGALAGTCSASDHFGYWLGRRYWGLGYATEAGGALLGAYFAETEDDHVVSGAFAENAASQKVLRKLGFRATGQSMRRCLARNADVAHIDMRLDRADWKAAPAR